MADIPRISHLARYRAQFAFLERSRWFIVTWPLGCLLLGCMLWFYTFNTVHSEQALIERNALKDAASLSRAYAQQLANTLANADQIALRAKYDWENSRGTFKFEQLTDRGLFPRSRRLYITIVDQNGIPVTSTLPIPADTRHDDRDFFIFHKQARSDALHISKPLIGRISGKVVLQMTHRLVTPENRFGGVVIVSVEQDYFTSFYESSSLGTNDLLAVVGNDGALRASQIGGKPFAPATPALLGLPPASLVAGRSLLNGQQWFADGKSRYTAWSDLTGYPLMAVVGLAQDDVLAAFQRTRRTYLYAAGSVSLFLLMFAVTGTYLLIRLAWRKQQAEDVKNTYRIATEGGNEGFYMVRALYDEDQQVVDFLVEDCNERGATFIGVARNKLVGRRFSEYYIGPHAAVVLNIFKGAMESGFYEDEFQVSPDSPLSGGWMQRRLVRSGTGLAMTLRDITESKLHEMELSRIANEDALTRLPNRHWLMHSLPAALEKLKTSDGMLALLFIDLDGFKHVNDTAGHAIGDELLKTAAMRLRSVLRPSDSVARLGGDEFTVILNPVLNENDASIVAGRIIDAFSQQFDLTAGKHRVGVSIGISMYPRDGMEADTLLVRADQAMYAIKAAGKGSYAFYRDSETAVQ